MRIENFTRIDNGSVMANFSLNFRGGDVIISGFMLVKSGGKIFISPPSTRLANGTYIKLGLISVGAKRLLKGAAMQHYVACK